MGEIVSGLFGGSSQKESSKSNSYNQAYNYLNGALSPTVSAGTAATGAQAALLGVGGDPAASKQAFDNYLNSTGYQFQRDQGMQGITNNAAVHGMLGSGATLKALDSFNQNLASTGFQNYLNNLGEVSRTGLGAAGTIAGAGGVSNSSSTGSSSSNKGLLGGITQLAGIAGAI